MTYPASLLSVRDTLVRIFGAPQVHFTTRRSDPTFPCAVYTLDNETVTPMISDLHRIESIEVSIDVQTKSAAEAMEKSEEIRAALETNRKHPARRTAFGIDEYTTEERANVRGAPKRLFIAEAAYTVYE